MELHFTSSQTENNPTKISAVINKIIIIIIFLIHSSSAGVKKYELMTKHVLFIIQLNALSLYGIIIIIIIIIIIGSK